MLDDGATGADPRCDDDDCGAEGSIVNAFRVSSMLGRIGTIARSAPCFYAQTNNALNKQTVIFRLKDHLPDESANVATLEPR